VRRGMIAFKVCNLRSRSLGIVGPAQRYWSDDAVILSELVMNKLGKVILPELDSPRIFKAPDEVGGTSIYLLDWSNESLETLDATSYGQQARLGNVGVLR
jgi:hypothetical protein